MTDFQFSAAYADYPSPESGLSSDNRDALTVTLAENNSWFMSDQRLKVNFGVGASQTMTRGSTYDAPGFFGSLGLNTPFIARSYLDLTGRLDYSNLTQGREVKTWTGTLGIFRNWSNHISSSLGFSHIESRSGAATALDALAYNRNLVMLNLFYQI